MLAEAKVFYAPDSCPPSLPLVHPPLCGPSFLLSSFDKWLRTVFVLVRYSSGIACNTEKKNGPPFSSPPSSISKPSPAKKNFQARITDEWIAISFYIFSSSNFVFFFFFFPFGVFPKNSGHRPPAKCICIQPKTYKTEFKINRERNFSWGKLTKHVRVRSAPAKMKERWTSYNGNGQRNWAKKRYCKPIEPLTHTIAIEWCWLQLHMH